MRVEVASLALQPVDMRAAAAQQLAHLLNARAIDLVEIEELVDLGQREAQPFAAQDPASRKPGSWGPVETHAGPAGAWFDQPLVLVEANGARRDAELAGEARQWCRCAWRCRAMLGHWPRRRLGAAPDMRSYG